VPNYRPFAFVLMPFEKSFEDIYRLGIKYVAESLDVVAERVDEQHFSETILERIYRQIENSDFIIADMTGRNPNVFYEVGYAHAKAKMCALITQNADDIPFDLKHHPHVIYDGSVGDLRQELVPKIKWMKEEAERKRAETISVSIEADFGFLEKTEYAHYGSFNLKLDLTNKSLARSPEIEAIYITTQPDWMLKVRGEECPSSRDPSTKLNRNLVAPSIRRLSPKAFLQEKIEFRRIFWSKYGVTPALNEYAVKGVLTIEVATSEGTLIFDRPLEISFDEIPF
jgi:hypothetical protein